MTKISIIVPIYNTASYLQECLDSVLNQSVRDIEVICINDGSTDSSLEILKNYQSKDNRVKIINQTNKGVGASRNIALSQSVGEYVLFLDSDDYIEENALEDILNVVESKKLDLLFFKIINFDDYTYKKHQSVYFEMDFLKKIVGNDIFNWQVVKNRLFDISVTCPGKLFKRELIKNIRFPEGMIFEDNVFFFKVIFRAKRVYFYDEYLYNRRLRDTSIMKSYHKHFFDCITVYEMIENFLRRIQQYNEFSDQLFNRKCRDIFQRFLMVDNEYKQEFHDRIKENFLKHQRHLERDGTLKVCNERSLVIFNSALSSTTYEEFELQVKVFDLKRDYDKLKLDNNIQKRQYNRNVSKLTQQNQNYLMEINDMKNSTTSQIINFLKSLFNR